jgi:anti-sigma factor RsiW
MTCESCQIELEDLLYGELDEARAAQVRSHLITCLACAAVRAELERENEIFSEFYEQTALDPAAEMWEAIRARIGDELVLPRREEKSKGWFGGLIGTGVLAWVLRPAILRQVAFAVVLIALTVAVTILTLKRGGTDQETLAIRDKDAISSPTPQPSLTPAPLPSPANGTDDGIPGRGEINSGRMPAPAPIRRSAPRAKPLTDQEMLENQLARAEREYQNAIKMLDRAIARRKDSLDPELFKQYQTSLALIDNSIAASRRAMRERPNDLAAGQFLLVAYARKVELMQDIAMR